MYVDARSTQRPLSRSRKPSVQGQCGVQGKAVMIVIATTPLRAIQSRLPTMLIERDLHLASCARTSDRQTTRNLGIHSATERVEEAIPCLQGLKRYSSKQAIPCLHGFTSRVLPRYRPIGTVVC
ncbi:hypothetical protein GY45DRAFT_58816 [Cubamyces sp. BRFM 1775]|nr:hypothetical protein GY45DRAFT_58816 [Cubamyces sp. BRFM 1775]